jgi:hypothetical protein
MLPKPRRPHEERIVPLPRVIYSRPTDQGSAKADIQLRATVSSGHQSRRYRSKALKQHRSHPVRFSSQTDLNREFKNPRSEWRWFLIPLLVFIVVDYLCLPILH